MRHNDLVVYCKSATGGAHGNFDRSGHLQAWITLKKATMKPLFDRLKLIFLGVFILASAGVFIYHAGWVWPRDKCEARGDWWDWRGRTCAHPILISDITGRVIDNKKARAEAKAAKASAPPAALPASKP